MTERDISVIKSAKDIKKYCCGEGEKCVGCVLWSGDDGCILRNGLPEDWELPAVKTYKKDFLSKFPNANFETSNLCRKAIYGGKHDCCGMTCEECWNEEYITDRTEERSK